MARYILYQTGPDNYSTYAECWGSTGNRGRMVASASTLVGLMDAVDQFDHDNWWICCPGGRSINSRREYYALPSVAKELARIAREEEGVVT